jgi:hypothetical protein
VDDVIISILEEVGVAIKRGFDLKGLHTAEEQAEGGSIRC